MSGGRAAFLRSVMLATSALVPLGIAPATANPNGPNVVGGAATVSGVGTSSVTVNQSSSRAIINWNTFNIGAGETTRFVQPNASSVALNRVTGNLGPSQLYGTLSANGRVFLVNPDGILVGRGAVIDTAGFLATTHDIRNDDFMAGRYRFDIPGRPDASVVNEGTINAHSHGFAALVAPGVRNSGTITAKFGKIGLAAGNGFSLDLYGDRLITLAVGDSVAATVKDVATGQPLGALVKNDGKLKATGGRVELTAASARAVVDSVINNSGVIEARSVGHRNGKIVLGGPTAATKVAGAPTQTVKVSGTLSTASKRGKGGTIQVTGEAIEIKAASFDASGATGGGKVLIGGDTGGGHGHWAVASIPQAALEAGAVPNATTVSIDAATTINASATSVGDGGKVIVWADGDTSFSGNILARGGAVSGNGGFAEVSGKQTLNYTGVADLRASNGSFGTLLLDPGNLTIQAAGVDSTTAGPGTFTGNDLADTVLLTSTLVNALGLSNVIVRTGTAAGFNDGDIIVASNFSWSSGSSLTLEAYRHITFNNGVTVANNGSGNFNLRADSTGIGTGKLNFLSTSDVHIVSAGSGDVKVYYNPTTFGTPDFPTSRVSMTGTGNLTAYMLVNSFANLQNLTDPAAGAGYALGRDIDAVGAGFNPLTFSFSRELDGLNRTISNFVINGSSMISHNAGIIRNLNLANVTVNVGANNQFVGPLVGHNTSTGQIINVHVTSGAVNGLNFTGTVAGGLIGQNAGEITNSSSAANVAVGNGLLGGGGGFNYAGGLVGINVGTVENSSASGNVTSGTNAFIGGLVGQNGNTGQPGGDGVINLSSATSNVSSAGTHVAVGGLVGTNTSGATITDSFAQLGTVTGSGNITGGNCPPTCQTVMVGGLVGQNAGLIESDASAFATFASGAVQVGSGGQAGGLVGMNHGLIVNALATGPVTGAAGGNATNDESRSTLLGGFVGFNNGGITASRATGNVGSPGVNGLMAGGFAGDNLGLIATSEATGNVTTGHFSQAGGFVGSGGGDSSGCFNCGDGSLFAGTNVILSSTASGMVSVGSHSIAGGFAGSGSIIVDSTADGAVTSGGDSIIGGFAGVHNIDGLIMSSKANGPVMSTGPNTWIGGFVGYNGGAIFDGDANGNVSATSASIVGGFFGMNIGWISTSVAHGTVSASGGGNVIGGFGGVNFGTVENSASTGAVSGAGANVTGAFLGANASFINFPQGQIGLSSFPTGTVVNSSGAGAQQIGVTNPTSLPGHPSIIANCDDAMCVIFQTGKLGSLANLIPDEVRAVPNLLQGLNSLDKPDTGALIQIKGPTTAPGGQPSGSPRPSQVPGTLPAPSTPNFSTYSCAAGTCFDFAPMLKSPHKSGELIVPFPAGTTPAVLQQLAERNGLTVLETFNVAGNTLVRYGTPSGVPLDRVMRQLQQQQVGSPQPTVVFQLVQAPAAAAAPTVATARRGDPAQYMTGKLHLSDAHSVASGSNITVAVIDSEVDREHSELSGTIAERFDATESDSRAHSHGTAMAGAIVSRDRLLGVAPGARILAVRAFSETQTSAESTTFPILKGIEWAVSQGARVINMSFAGPYDPSLERALKDAAAKGVVLIAASGNAGPKSAPLWPGADPNVIAVTATDSGDKLFRQANRGPYVSVASPGVEILAPAPQAGYQMSTGTSIATAHVSGVVALMLERDPTLTPRDVRLILEATANDLGPKGRDTQYGWGLVNPAKALAMVDERKRQKGSASAPPAQR